jgi:hypothetical protein
MRLHAARDPVRVDGEQGERPDKRVDVCAD